MSTHGGVRAIVAALLANLGIAIAKFAAYLVTGSASMLAESVHSLADTGNQALLLLGGRTASRAATPEHPFGYGRDRYFYAFVVSLVLFSLGSLFSLYEGFHTLANPHALESPAVALVVLAVAIGLEGFSFRTAIHESNQVRGQASWVGFIRHAKAPELPVVLLEDLAALVGLLLALCGVGLTTLTGNSRWDALGTIGIGLLLGAVAVVLIVETKSLLIGEAAAPRTVQAIERALVGGAVERVIHLRTLHLGPEELLVAAKVALPPAATAAQVAAEIDEAEARVRAAVPIARVVYLEPDLDRELSASRPSVE
jgi:cation diffusion facilitator family transporter